MLIFNTTYQVEQDEEKMFLTWLNAYLLPQVAADGRLNNPRVMRVLGSHATDDTPLLPYAVQFEVADTAVLHKWYQTQGAQLEREMLKVFKEKVLCFSTLMETLDDITRVQ